MVEFLHHFDRFVWLPYHKPRSDSQNRDSNLTYNLLVDNELQIRIRRASLRASELLIHGQSELIARSNSLTHKD